MSDDEAVLVLAPTGRDAALTADLLHRAGFAAASCADMADLTGRLSSATGALLVAEEALSPQALRCLTDVLAAQESWSDVPVVVFTSAGWSAAATRRMEDILSSVGNVIFMERPLRALTLISAVKSALRARARQHEVRNVMQRQARSEAEAKEAVRFLQQLLGIVSHDLRNPISAVLISAETLLRRDALSDKQRRGLTRIVQAGRRANAMVLDLLDFTRARLGREMPLQMLDCDLGSLARQLVDELSAAHPDREIALAVEGDLRGQWDPGRAAQVLQNLVGNALQYSKADAPVRVYLGAEGTDRILLRVQNTGSVIAQEQQVRIFEPMERGDGAQLVTPESGSRSVGLGLHIVKQIVLTHGGSIGLSSSLEAGTTFDVRLPRRPERSSLNMQL